MRILILRMAHSLLFQEPKNCIFMHKLNKVVGLSVENGQEYHTVEIRGRCLVLRKESIG
jgi:hypothetical protein